jgi:hypothetical protein
MSKEFSGANLLRSSLKCSAHFTVVFHYLWWSAIACLWLAILVCYNFMLSNEFLGRNILNEMLLFSHRHCKLFVLLLLQGSHCRLVCFFTPLLTPLWDQGLNVLCLSCHFACSCLAEVTLDLEDVNKDPFFSLGTSLHGTVKTSLFLAKPHGHKIPQ